MLGRGTRTYPGKTDCLVLDVVGVSTHHTLHTAATLFACDAEQLARQSVLVHDHAAFSEIVRCDSATHP